MNVKLTLCALLAGMMALVTACAPYAATSTPAMRDLSRARVSYQWVPDRPAGWRGDDLVDSCVFRDCPGDTDDELHWPAGSSHLRENYATRNPYRQNLGASRLARDVKIATSETSRLAAISSLAEQAAAEIGALNTSLQGRLTSGELKPEEYQRLMRPLASARETIAALAGMARDRTERLALAIAAYRAEGLGTQSLDAALEAQQRDLARLTAAAAASAQSE